MVPPNWQHPKNDRGHLQTMYHGNFADKFAAWLADFDRIRAGDLTSIERECYAEPGMNPLAEWLRDEGTPLDPKGYEPWRKEGATWVQVWETVSEGTPVTPPFATKAELVDYLVAGGDDWDRKSGRGGYSRAQAEAFVEQGWVPSMVLMNSGSGQQLFMGIESAGVVGGKP